MRRISRGSRPAPRGAVDDGLRLADYGRRPVVHQRGRPAVGNAPGERERARLVGAEPDLDPVRRRGPRSHALEPVVAALEAQEPAAAKARLDATAAEQVERRRRLREHGRWAQRQVADVLEDADPLGLGEDHTEQRQRVQVCPLIGMVLDGE
jgi:hypothetical protein